MVRKLKRRGKFTEREKEVAEKYNDKLKSIFEGKKDTTEKPTKTESDGTETAQAIQEVESFKLGVNLYPSTGRNLKSLKPGEEVEQLTDSQSQRLWFEVLDSEVSKNPEAYTVKVVKVGDKTNEELHTQIQRDVDPSNTRDTDLYVVLYKDGKPVLKNSSDNKILPKPVTKDDISIAESNQWIDDLFTRFSNLVKTGDSFTVTSQGFTYTIRPTIQGFTIEFGGQTQFKSWVNNKNDITKWFSKGGEIHLSSSGSYVFSSLWRPDTLYPVKDGRPVKYNIRPETIQEFYFSNLGFTVSDISQLSNTQKLLIENESGLKPTKENIETAAFLFAKKDYQEWYDRLQTGNEELRIAGVTNGHSIKKREDGKIAWNKPLNGIPNLSLVNDKNGTKLIGGKLQLSTTGYIKTPTGEYKIKSGDTVIVDKEGNLHPIRSRTLNDAEIQTVLYLLSLRAVTGIPTESIFVNHDGYVIGNKSIKKIPVFYNTAAKQSRANLIESIISFGKSDSKGEIYFNKESLADNPLLVWTDFNGDTFNLPLSEIKEAVENNDFTKIQSLVDFLSQKRININEHLLGNGETSNKFSTPNLTYVRDASGKQVPELQWVEHESYISYLLNDVTTTTTFKLAGYPNRVQRNLYFHKTPIFKEEDYSSLEEEIPSKPVVQKRERKAVKSIDSFKDADKILTVSDLLKQKLQSGEITKNCK